MNFPKTLADLLTISPDDTMAEAASLLINNAVESLEIRGPNGELMGMMDKTTLLKAASLGISPRTPVAHIINRMTGAFYLQSIASDGVPGSNVDFMSNSYEELMEENEELKDCLDSMYNPVISVDKNGHIKILNKSAQSLLGISAEEAQGCNITNVLHTSRLEDVLKTGEIQSTQKLFAHNKIFISNRSPIMQNGQITGAVAVLQDISELDNIVNELEYTKRLNRELDAIFESSFDGLYVTDGNGVTLRLNKGFERITGIPASKCIGRNMKDLVAEGIYSRSGTLMALEQKQRVTITLQVNTGQSVLVTSTPIFDDEGNIILVVTNARDVTELNGLQRKLEHVEGLSRFYQTELQQLKLQNSKQLVVNSNKMRELVKLVIRVASVDSTVLIQGESGVGKELIADIMYAKSGRKDGPFIKVNCGAIPENLLESELFGYDPGAFSGANKNGKAGLFELASGGVLFLDEIGDMPLNLQVKLLRAIQDMEICRVGGIKPIKLDLRIFAGTNRNLNEMVANGQFRQDLYYRLNVVPIHVPPLRDRKEDIPILSTYFLQMFNRKYHMNKRLTADVMGCFMDYDWPGNVRELENLIERVVVTTSQDTITNKDLPTWLAHSLPKDGMQQLVPLRCAVENAERQVLQYAFSLYKSTYDVAEALEVNQSTVVRKAAKYGIKRS